MPIVIRRSSIRPMHWLVHGYAWSGLVVMAYDFFAGRLGPNPVQALEQRSGRHAFALLLLSLACTPLNALFGWKNVLKYRRMLGLYAALYAAIHALIFVDLDYGLAWDVFRQTVIEKPYILYGMTAFLMLIPLAATSFDIWKARLGKNWKRMHRLVYLAASIAILHSALSKKGDLFRLQGDILRPLVYSLLLVFLLALRLPWIRGRIVSLRTRVRLPFLGRLRG